MRETNLKEYLSSLDKPKLQEEIIELFRLLPEARNYYKFKLEGTLEKNLLNLYKEKLKGEFFYNILENRVSYSGVGQVLMEFQSISNMPNNVLELMFYYIDLALKFIDSYKIEDEGFYIFLEGVFQRALNIIFKNGLENKFKEKVEDIIYKSNEGLFGLKNTMSSIYSSYY